MRSDSSNHSERTTRRAIWACTIIGFGAWLALILVPSHVDRSILQSRNRSSASDVPSSHDGPQDPRPPQLDGCTQIEIRFLPSALEAVFPEERERTILNNAEIGYLRSLRTIIVNDAPRVDSIASDIARARFIRRPRETNDLAQLTCLRGDETIASFTIVGQAIEIAWWSTNEIRIKGGLYLRCSDAQTDSSRLAPEIEAFTRRRECARSLVSLASWLAQAGVRAGLSPDHWCDKLAKSSKEMIEICGEDWPRIICTCPEAKERGFCYAMNPACEPDSPADTVFLFESGSGWNQSGGSELFEFDHHQPQGGCVLLNDGGVRFIRTPEELRQLRWK